MKPSTIRKVDAWETTSGKIFLSEEQAMNEEVRETEETCKTIIKDLIEPFIYSLLAPQDSNENYYYDFTIKAGSLSSEATKKLNTTLDFIVEHFDELFLIMQRINQKIK